MSKGAGVGEILPGSTVLAGAPAPPPSIVKGAVLMPLTPGPALAAMRARVCRPHVPELLVQTTTVSPGVALGQLKAEVGPGAPGVPGGAGRGSSARVKPSGSVAVSVYSLPSVTSSPTLRMST